MDNIFILNPAVSSFDIKDAIDERLNKVQAIISCFMANNTSDMELPRNKIFNTIWAIDDYLDKISYLNNYLNSRSR